MNERDFRERLALEPVVRDLSSLPSELRRAAERDDALRRIVRERIRLDALLDEVDEIDVIEPSATFTDDVVREAFRGDRTGARHLVPLRTKLAAAAVIAAILAVGLLLTRERSGDEERRVAQEIPAEDPEMIARLDLFLDDWEEVLGHEDDLDMVASLAVAEVLDALPDDPDTPR